jgi:hypothetical protein
MHAMKQRPQIQIFPVAKYSLFRGPEGTRLPQLLQRYEQVGCIFLLSGEIVRFQAIPVQGSAEGQSPVGQRHDGLR